MEPTIFRNVSLHKMVDRFLSVMADIVGEDGFERLIENDPRKMDEFKLNVVAAMKGHHGLNGDDGKIGDDGDRGDKAMFNNVLGSMLDPIFKELDRLLAMKQIEGSKQHIIISGEMADIEWVQSAIRARFRAQKRMKIKEESVHFAKSKRAKGAALFDIVTPKHQSLTYRANKSWGISVQRDFIPEQDDKSKRIKGREHGQWVVNGVFHEIIRMGEQVRANHCEVVWVRPIHDTKIQIDVYSKDSPPGQRGHGDGDCVLYIDECEYEGSETFELLKEWKEQSEIPVVFWCEVEENNKIRLHVSVNNLADAQSRIFDLRWSVK